MPIGGRMFDRTGARLPTLMGFSLLVGATALLLLIDADTAWPLLVIILALRGLGTGLGSMPTTTAAMVAVRGVSEARVSALINITRQIASALAVALLATLLQARVSAHTPAGTTLSTVRQASPAVVHDAVLGFHEAFAVLLLGAAPVLLLSFFLRETRAAESEVTPIAVESVA
jgi:MFS family permease